MAAVLFGGLTFSQFVMAGQIGNPLAPEVCSEFPEEKDFICKAVFITQEGDPDGEVGVNEMVVFNMIITVHNDSTNQWDNIIVKDRFGAELDVINCQDVGAGTVNTFGLTTIGNSDKERLVWTIGTLTMGAIAVLECQIETDTTPGGEQSYTECGEQEFNSGANLKFTVGDPAKKRSFETGPVIFDIPCSEEASTCQECVDELNAEACVDFGCVQSEWLAFADCTLMCTGEAEGIPDVCFNEGSDNLGACIGVAGDSDDIDACTGAYFTELLLCQAD